MRIVFVASEVVPFAKTGGLADVCGSLPRVLNAMGHELMIIMPYYKSVGPKDIFNNRASVEILDGGIKIFFIKNNSFYERDALYGDSSGDYTDNLDRFSFFCHEALNLLQDIGQPVDIIHCHDWQTGLIPVILKDKFADEPFFAGTKTVFTIHNMAYQGLFSKDQFAKTGVDIRFFNNDYIEYYGQVNLLKTGIVFADYVTTVSPQYAKDIQTKEFGFGLDGILQARKGRIAGILNGLDYVAWNPEHDEYIDPPYSPGDQLPKKVQKERLQHKFGLSVMSDIPVFGFVGRLCFQKGIDLIESAFDELTRRPIQLVFLGVGEDKYQKMLKKLSKKHPQQFCAMIKYNEDIVHQVIAGSDFFLMPSVYEPCGLTQMIALRYGTIPIVSAVGGLSDTVFDFSSGKKMVNGFVLPAYSVFGLLATIDRAVGLFNQKDRFAAMISSAMACRYTWEASAKQYVEVYRQCRS